MERKNMPFPDIPLFPETIMPCQLPDGTLIDKKIPAETRPAGIIPSSSNESVFNQSFIPAVDVIETLDDYAKTQDMHQKRNLVRNLAHRTFTHAGSFGQIMTTLNNLTDNERFSKHLPPFKESFLKALGQEAKTEGTTPPPEVLGEYLERV